MICFNARWGECEGEVAECNTLGIALCRFHHTRLHGAEVPVETRPAMGPGALPGERNDVYVCWSGARQTR